MPRFVLLHHELPEGGQRASHWDLMLEQDGVLRTWAVERPLPADIEIACRALGDHRLAYLDYEGPVSGNRGQVTRTDGGTYAIVDEQESEVTVRLKGAALVGTLHLRRMAAPDGGEDQTQSWVARFLPESKA